MIVGVKVTLSKPVFSNAVVRWFHTVKLSESELSNAMMSIMVELAFEQDL